MPDATRTVTKRTHAGRPCPKCGIGSFVPTYDDEPKCAQCGWTKPPRILAGIVAENPLVHNRPGQGRRKR